MKLPARIAKLPQDSRGYPIPWNVLIGKDGKPIFTANDSVQHFKALSQRLCPICGQGLERIKWFIGGPLSAFSPHGWYQDLPTHQECAQFALSTCPYLAAPRYLHRIDLIDPAQVPDEVQAFIDPTMIPDRPLVFVAIAARKMEISSRESVLPLVRPVRPILGIQYWKHGKQLSCAAGEKIVRSVFGKDWVFPQKFVK